jgi:hypothetical protein
LDLAGDRRCGFCPTDESFRKLIQNAFPPVTFLGSEFACALIKLVDNEVLLNDCITYGSQSVVDNQAISDLHFLELLRLDFVPPQIVVSGCRLR